MKRLICLVVGVCLIVASGTAFGGPENKSGRGLSAQATRELQDAGVDQYMGEFSPAISEDIGGGWIRHIFDTDGGDGPICIAGTPYTAFTRARNPAKLLVFLQGGGACWQDFYFCNILADSDSPTASPFASGIWVDSFDTGTETIANPLADWSVVYLSYCDGSVFMGDNDVVDANFPFGPVRFHRGLRNVTAGIDLARAEFPHASRILLAGSSAGGVGAAALAPFLARFAYGNNKKLTVFNDAGPVAINLDEVAAIQARAADWQFGQFLPASCVDCDDEGQTTKLIDWRLENDTTIREAFYSTDGDATDRFFLNIPTQEQYRELIVTEHGLLNEAYPNRYKRFIRSGDDEHTALQLPTFYLGEADGVPLDVWTADFVVPRPFWVDIVEDFVPIP
jgi:hypothetical protein